IRIEAGLVQELGGLQGVESAPERLLGQIRNRCEERVWHVLAPDDRGDLQQAFVLRRELIDARGKQRLGGGRDLDRLDGSSQPIFASLPGQFLRSHEGSNRLLQKGRVPAPNEELLERRKAGVVSEQGIQQLSRALDRKRVESNLTVEGLAGPGVLVLGPVAHEQQELRRADAVDQRVEDSLTLAVDPVQVLEDHDERLLSRLPQQQLPYGVEGPLATLSGAERRPRRIVDRYVEQRQQRWSRGLVGAIARDQSVGDLVQNFLGIVAIRDLEEALQEIDHRQVARRFAVRERVAF